MDLVAEGHTAFGADGLRRLIPFVVVRRADAGADAPPGRLQRIAACRRPADLVSVGHAADTVPASPAKTTAMTTMPDDMTENSSTVGIATRIARARWIDLPTCGTLSSHCGVTGVTPESGASPTIPDKDPCSRTSEAWGMIIGSMVTLRSRRIALTGSHGTGKTTLANALVADLAAKGLTAASVPEVPREVCTAAGDPEFFRRENNSLTRQITLLYGQPVFERRAEASGPSVVVCDRTVLDHWAYTTALFADALRGDGLDKVLASFTSSYMPSYDLIAYVPIEFGPVDDGTREGDVLFQQQIDQRIRDLLGEFAVNHLVVRGSVGERLDQLHTAIKQHWEPGT